MLALTLLLLAQDEIFILGEATFKEAQDHFEKREWFDCIEKAERARNMFLAMEDLYASQNKKNEQKEASEYVKRCNQLVKLAADARFADKKATPPPPPVETPKPKVEPPPPPPPKPDPGLLPQSVVVFKKILAGEIALDDADAVAPMMTGLKALDGPWKTWGQVARAIATRWIKGEFKPPEALKEYAAKFLIEPMKFDHRGAAKFLIDRAPDDLNAWRQVRWLALAHISEALIDPESPLFYELPGKAEALDLVKEGGRESWPTREGNLIELTKMAKDIPTIKDPLRLGYRAIYLFEHIEKPADLAPCRTAVQNASPVDPDLMNALKARLEAAKPCKWCGGAGRRKCDNSCADGKKQLTCSRCNGLGYLMTRGGTQPCPEQPPRELTQPKKREGESDRDFRKRLDEERRRGRQNIEKHSWLVDCPKCQGTTKIDCKDCKEPWSMKRPEVSPCDGCRSSGWLIDRVKLPCPDCYGIGHRLKK